MTEPAETPNAVRGGSSPSWAVPGPGEPPGPSPAATALTQIGVGAPVTATTASVSNRSASLPSVTSTQAASGSLPTSLLASPKLAVSAAPLPGTPRCAKPARPRSWTVASGPGWSTWTRRAPAGGAGSRTVSSGSGHGGTLAIRRNRTRLEAVSSAGGSRSGSHSGAAVRPSSRQPPREAASDGDRACWHAHARAVEPGHGGEQRVEPGEVRKTRGEPEPADLVLRGLMPRDHVCNGQAR